MDEKQKMAIYESLATPPNDAVKEIKGGNLKGFSDINPQWRYEALTRQFGACGVGWKYTIDSHWTSPAQGGEVLVFVMISFYYKDGDKWSEPIPAYGGDFLVKKDKYGLHGNDEAMKMAVTDALGTACKMIGVAADVYRGLIAHGASDSKYARRQIPSQTPQNGAGERLQQNAGIYKGNTNNDLKTKAMHALSEKMKACNLTKEQMAAIAGAKYGKVSTKEMTIGEISDLANNLDKYIEEIQGQA